MKKETYLDGCVTLTWPQKKALIDIGRGNDGAMLLIRKTVRQALECQCLISRNGHTLTLTERGEAVFQEIFQNVH